MTVGYVVKRYPRFSETFVVNEILAHEAAGERLEIFALRQVEETHFQNIISRVRAPVTRIPDRIKGIDESWPQLAALHAQIPEAWARLADFPEATGRDILQGARLAIECRQRGVTHLHAHFGTVASTVARIAARLAGITWSVTLHAKDIYMDYAENRNLGLKIADADAVVTVSDFNRQFLKDRFGRDVQRIYNGMDLGGFAWTAPAPEATEILAVGRLVEKKGFHILIEALRLMRAAGRNVPCRIVGSGEMRAELQSQIDASGVDVTLAGPMPQTDVMEAMRNAALLACPCVVGDDGNRDGMPTVLLEAMALGCPTVATPVTGIPELIEDGATGLLAREGDAASLAAQMTRLLDDAALRADLSRRARQRIEADYDLANSAAALRGVFDATKRRAA